MAASRYVRSSAKSMSVGTSSVWNPGMFAMNRGGWIVARVGTNETVSQLMTLYLISGRNSKRREVF